VLITEEKKIIGLLLEIAAAARADFDLIEKEVDANGRISNSEFG